MPDPFFSELKYLGGATDDFIEVAVDAGTDVSDLVVTVYRSNGSIRSSNDLSVLTPTTVNGKDVYLIEAGDATNFNGLALSEAVSLSENGTVFSFLSFDDTAGVVTPTTGPAAGLTSTDIGMAGAGSSLETADGGATYFTQTTPDPNNVVCLTTGAAVQTKNGLVNVEDLAEGMQILTYEGEYQVLRKVFSRKVREVDLKENQKLFPVRICAGALGNGSPTQDLLVSRQHRMLVSSPIVKRMFDKTNVLIASVRLISLPGIFVDGSIKNIKYFHLLFDRHEVIFANGAATESLFLGVEAMKSLPIQSKEELRAIFPDLMGSFESHSSKYYVPSIQRQRQLVMRHLKNQHDLVSKPV
ncbi:Hint domain-containing protein [Octadecabacter sp.]|nr:Hint domain-containing protein [Octadecabacter sp.]